MTPPLGRSKTIRWGLCACRFCERSRALFRFTKRTARRRETRLWQRENDLMPGPATNTRPQQDLTGPAEGRSRHSRAVTGGPDRAALGAWLQGGV